MAKRKQAEQAIKTAAAAPEVPNQTSRPAEPLSESGSAPTVNMGANAMSSRTANGHKVKLKAIEISLPVGFCHAGYCSDRVATRLTRRQSAALKMLWSSMSEAGDRCEMEGIANPHGQPVNNQGHAVRRILDLVADEYEKQGDKSLMGDFDLTFSGDSRLPED